MGVWLLDKSALLIDTHSVLPAPAVLRHQVACALFQKVIEKGALARLLCDEDIRGKGEWKSFRTEILRINRRVRPDDKIKVAAWPSHQSPLIQAADCLAYVFGRSIRGAALNARLRQDLRALQRREDNIFMVCEAWGQTPGET